jgi:hypothetical protein
LSSSPFILASGYLAFTSLASQRFAFFASLPFADYFQADPSLQFKLLLRLVLFILASGIGGVVGQMLYSPEIDLDLEQQKVTVFGVRWAHYF